MTSKQAKRTREETSTFNWLQTSLLDDVAVQIPSLAFYTCLAKQSQAHYVSEPLGTKQSLLAPNSLSNFFLLDLSGSCSGRFPTLSGCRKKPAIRRKLFSSRWVPLLHLRDITVRFQVQVIMNIDFMNLNFRNRISKNINYKNVWITSMNTRRTRIASLFAIFLLLRRVLSWATRWRLHRQIESYYDGRYALNEEDVRKGLPRMNQCGYRGVHDAQTILRLVQFKESPLLYHKALEFALFR